MNKSLVKPVFLLFAITVLIVSCSKPEAKLQKFTLDGRVQGTYYHIVYYHFDDKAATKKNLLTQAGIQHGIDSIFKAIDETLSLWNPNSILSKVNENKETLLNQIFIDNFNSAMAFSELTDGDFDITVAPLIKAYGFANEKGSKPTDRQADSLLQYIGYKKVQIKDGKLEKQYPQTQLDFNAIAQGYTTDCISKYLSAHNITSHIVDVGGEVYASGKKPDGQQWRVAIEQPSDSIDAPRRYNTLIRLENQSIVTSGNYRKYTIENGIKYTHTINPHTGKPAKHSLLSVSVTAPTSTEADALATAFMVMGMEKAEQFMVKHPEYQAVFIYCDKDGKTKTKISETLKSKIETVE